MEKPKNLYVQSMDMNQEGRGMLAGEGCRAEGRERGEKSGKTIIA